MDSLFFIVKFSLYTDIVKYFVKAGRPTDKIPYHFCIYYYFCDKVSYNEIESSVKQIHITFRRTSRK